VTPKNATLLCALALIACAGAQRPKQEIVWPDPPEKPRVKFVRSFSSSDDLNQSSWASFKKSVLGGATATRFDQPMGLALSADGERLYVADFRASNVFVADLKARTLRPFSDKAAFAQPFNVALDASENVYVSDSGARSVTAYTRAGVKLWSVSKDLERPTGLAVDPQRGVLYVADSSRVESQNHRVLAYDLSGHLLREIGAGRGSDDGQFAFPIYLAVDAAGNLHVGDTMNFRVQVFDPDGHFLRKFGEHGDSPGTFSRIKGMAFDSFQNLYVVDGQHSVVQIFNRDFDPLLFFGGFAPLVEYFDIPSCIAIDRRSNRIYVCNEHTPRINVYDLVNTRAEDSIVAREGAERTPAPAVR
jgi:DNA-binding beta-propeller fold protein YncE